MSLSDKSFWMDKRGTIDTRSKRRYLEKDVKAFIKELKEAYGYKDLHKIIDELAGDKLI